MLSYHLIFFVLSCMPFVRWCTFQVDLKELGWFRNASRVWELCQQWLCLGVTGLASLSLQWMVALLQNSEPWAVWLIRNTRSALDVPWTLSQFYPKSSSHHVTHHWQRLSIPFRVDIFEGSPVYKLITQMEKLQFMCISSCDLQLGISWFSFQGITSLWTMDVKTNYVKEKIQSMYISGSLTLFVLWEGQK